MNLSRTVNGEMFIHKVHFTNIKRRVIEMPAGFVSTNRIAYNSAPNLQPLISAMDRNIRIQDNNVEQKQQREGCEGSEYSS